ncbi:uncharacterized protein [Macaca fascicularis]|uniref:uncharacterized protein n=1 Tax=Macaca fascicularis TaxID=9541 RepID=UPI003D1591D0
MSPGSSQSVPPGLQAEELEEVRTWEAEALVQYDFATLPLNPWTPWSSYGAPAGLVTCFSQRNIAEVTVCDSQALTSPGLPRADAHKPCGQTLFKDPLQLPLSQGPSGDHVVTAAPHPVRPGSHPASPCWSVHECPHPAAPPLGARDSAQTRGGKAGRLQRAEPRRNRKAQKRGVTSALLDKPPRAPRHRRGHAQRRGSPPLPDLRAPSSGSVLFPKELLITPQGRWPPGKGRTPGLRPAAGRRPALPPSSSPLSVSLPFLLLFTQPFFLSTRSPLSPLRSLHPTFLLPSPVGPSPPFLSPTTSPLHSPPSLSPPRSPLLRLPIRVTLSQSPSSPLFRPSLPLLSPLPPSVVLPTPPHPASPLVPAPPSPGAGVTARPTSLPANRSSPPLGDASPGNPVAGDARSSRGPCRSQT